tara:strand:- start:165 stop:392 length:228 start_codon:yes stop_codon:yes gene_type:complete
MSRTYCIINSTDVSSINFSQVFETSADTLRYSVDDSQTFVKYEGAKPRFLYGKDTYTHSEMLNILAGSDWAEPFE